MRLLAVIFLLCLGRHEAHGLILQSSEAEREIVRALQSGDAARRLEAVLRASALDQARALPLLQRAATDPDVGVRATAVTALGHLLAERGTSETPHALPTLLAALTDPHPLVRQAAAWALGRVRDPQASTALEAALRDSDAAVRAAAVEAIGERQEETLLTALLHRLHDQDAFVRRQAARALGRLRSHAATLALMERLLKEKDPEVKRAIAWALGEIEDPRAQETLRTLSRSPDPYVSAIARDALDRLSSQAERKLR